MRSSLGMIGVALKMLIGDPIKYFGLAFGIGFATFLVSQQMTLFNGLLTWSANPVLDVRQAQLWVMDPRVKQADQSTAMPDQALYRVRSVSGVGWAVPYLRVASTVKTTQGEIAAIILVGLDNQSLIGLPSENLEQNIQALRGRNLALVDRKTTQLIWSDSRDPLKEVIEINDNRVAIRGLTSNLTTFTGLPTVYMKYTDAIAITPPQRNKLSFILVHTAPGTDVGELAKRIEVETGLKALTRREFGQAGTQYLLDTSGVPIVFGAAIGLGIIVAIVITSLTLAMFVSENYKNFGALKAIGVTNQQLVVMIISQALLVGFIGYGLGIGGTTIFLFLGQGNTSLAGLTLLGQIVGGTAVLVTVIVIGSALLSVQKLLRMDPAIVFRG
jgi:putative ABC transport system permease protein